MKPERQLLDWYREMKYRCETKVTVYNRGKPEKLTFVSGEDVVGGNSDFSTAANWEILNLLMNDRFWTLRRCFCPFSWTANCSAEFNWTSHIEQWNRPMALISCGSNFGSTLSRSKHPPEWSGSHLLSEKELANRSLADWRQARLPIHMPFTGVVLPESVGVVWMGKDIFKSGQSGVSISSVCSWIHFARCFFPDSCFINCSFVSHTMLQIVHLVSIVRREKCLAGAGKREQSVDKS